MVAHNADFDMSFIIENCKRQGLPQEYTYVDTVGMARFLLPALNRFKLDTVAKAVGVSSGPSSQSSGRCSMYGRDFCTVCGNAERTRHF